MLIPKIKVRILSTTQEFDSAFDRAMFLNESDSNADRIFSFYYVNNCEIIESFNTIGKTCNIVIPRNYKFTLKPITDGLNKQPKNNAPQVDSKEKESGFMVGDIVEVYMTLEHSQEGEYFSYGEKRRYRGFIKAITPSDNVLIECEDEAWLLKQKKLQKAYKKGIVLDYVKDMCKGIISPEKIKGGSLATQSEAQFTASGYRLKRNPTIYKAIQGLDQNFKMRAWFRDGELYVGKLWYESISEARYQEAIDNGRPHNFEFQRNICSDNLKYQKKESYLKGVEVEIINSNDNSREKVFVGTDDGDVERIPAMDITVSDAKALAEAHLKRITYDGFRGSFTAHIEPEIQHGDYVKIKDPRFDEERSGIYVVEKVVLSFKPNGAFQTIYLNSKVEL